MDRKKSLAGFTLVITILLQVSSIRRFCSFFSTCKQIILYVTLTV